MDQASEGRRQAVEQIMRSAEAMGLDPQRVARALDHQAREPVEYQAVEEVQSRSWVRRSFARASRRSSGGP